MASIGSQFAGHPPEGARAAGALPGQPRDRERTPAPARRLSSGAEIMPDGVHFRVWAPERRQVTIVVDGRDPLPLARESHGYWSGLAAGLEAGARYRIRLDSDEESLPDPFSRFQPEGPHGSSEVINPSTFRWTDGAWAGISPREAVIYEMHVGTFSEEGTWAGALPHLAALKETGVTVLQVMPVAEFAGQRGWGYDGVDLFAPYHGYGRPDSFKRFVNEAHALGLGVILDVVYNHFGPDGNYLERFAKSYFSDRQTEWGAAINYDGPGCEGTRTLVTENAAYWTSEYHLDGLRLDATQSIFDRSPEHIVTALARAARTAAGARSILIVAENEPQDSQLLRAPTAGGSGLDAVYNEDLHHSALVAATGKMEGYYSEYAGTAQEFVSAVKYGYLFQGQRYHWQKKRRGHPTRGIAPWQIASFLENHDQVANSARGLRLWQLTSPGRHRALTTYLLLGPWTPMLFQGAEWNTTSPFFYFSDHRPELQALVRTGRGEFLAQFPSCATRAAQAALADPGALETFTAARLRWDERSQPEHVDALALHRDLLTLRREDPTLRAQGRGDVSLDGAVLGDEAFVIRHVAPEAGAERLLVVNLGRELRLRPAPEPLLAPPEGARWRLRLSSDDVRYGGPGAVMPESEDEGWTLPGQTACFLEAEPEGTHE